MKDIQSLPADIYEVLAGGTEPPADASLAAYGANVARHLSHAVDARVEKIRPPKTVYASEIGDKCTLRLALKMHSPKLAAPLEPWVRMKFLYGNIIEETVLELARAAGHTVECEQEPLSFTIDDWTVTGKIDALVDGILVDVKSCSEYAFNKYRTEGLTTQNDSFGYIDQLEAYERGMGKTTIPWTDESGWILMNKANGMIAYEMKNAIPLLWDESMSMKLEQVDKHIADLGLGVKASTLRPFKDEPEGKSGNMKLGLQCSYCAFKKLCWPGYRTFLYAKGPVFLTKVVREPKDVKEVFNA